MNGSFRLHAVTASPDLETAMEAFRELSNAGLVVKLDNAGRIHVKGIAGNPDKDLAAGDLRKILDIAEEHKLSVTAARVDLV